MYFRVALFINKALDSVKAKQTYEYFQKSWVLQVPSKISRRQVLKSYIEPIRVLISYKYVFTFTCRRATEKKNVPVDLLGI